VVGNVSATVDFNPTDITELPAAALKARVQIAAIKTQQEMDLLQVRELSRLMEPHKGANLDARA
jgi:hypothetical protein